MTENKLQPVHPGEVLLEEFLKPMKLSQNRLAIGIGVNARRVNEIVLGRRRVTADTALRFSKFFGNSPQFWMGLQSDYDLDVAQDSLKDVLETEVREYAFAYLTPLQKGLFYEGELPESLLYRFFDFRIANSSGAP